MGISWKGADGTVHEFGEHPYESDWADVGGVYIFAARLANGDWNPLYVGNADSLVLRIRASEKWPWAVRLGANGVLACSVPDATRRIKMVAELIARLKPPLNDYPENRIREIGSKRRAGHRTS
jgi:hypothetical protein